MQGLPAPCLCTQLLEVRWTASAVNHLPSSVVSGTDPSKHQARLNRLDRLSRRCARGHAMPPRRTLHGEPGWARAHRLSRRSPKARDTASTPPTRQVPAQTTTPPAASMRLRSSVRLGLWSSDSAITAQHRNAPLSPVPARSDAAPRWPEPDHLLLLKASASPRLHASVRLRLWSSDSATAADTTQRSTSH